MSETTNEVLAERIGGMSQIISTEITGMKELISEKFTTNEVGHNAILIQTTKTNGRVTKLETWQNKIIGGLIISNMVVIPVLAWVVKMCLKD